MPDLDRAAVDWYFDFISPYAWLQAESLDRLPPERRADVQAGPVRGPARALGPARSRRDRSPSARSPTATSSGAPASSACTACPPPHHPFNPLPLLRLAIVLGRRARCHAAPVSLRVERRQASRTTRRRGARCSRSSGCRMQTHASPLPKSRRSCGATARRPSRAVCSACRRCWSTTELFWGADATTWLRDYLRGDPLFGSEQMRVPAACREGKMRPRQLARQALRADPSRSAAAPLDEQAVAARALGLSLGFRGGLR